MYRVALAILKAAKKSPAELKNLKVTDLETKFTLSKNNDILSKTQGMLNNLQAGIHPRIAIRQSNQFSDPEGVYEESKPYIEKAMEKMHAAAEKAVGAVDVTNQPKGGESLEGAVAGKGTVQKQD